MKKANSDVAKDVSIINKDAENTWLFKLKLSNPKELDSLLTKDQYLATLKK
jgi:glycine cleavage system H lipoate-binding protein